MDLPYRAGAAHGGRMDRWMPRGYAPFEASREQDALLDAIVARCRPGELAVFDLDGCLFDTRARQVHLLRALASRRGWWELYRVREEHFADRDLARTLQAAGIAAGRAAVLAPACRAFFREHFLASVAWDHAMPGAADLVRACAAAGARPVWFTARASALRPLTLAGLERWGFPAGQVVDKPDERVPDRDFKLAAVAGLSDLGEPAVFLDNEPDHLHAFADAFPGALPVWVETDASRDAAEPRPGVLRLRSFLRVGALG